ncbi:HupE/UreJ family protein [Paenibacillus filicis]|uniref:HupE/UreJ family protein n=1 Tax=Paenibacillus gyeongsangnamensis TaxID=3388067 RepID=A0ABT4QE59_9BACL|nr:HupE/UreJ family protein [Paenibacillus filicis]MCZ8515157.1 HupE/UreJ family protein [Paenibacillus filicis]
MTIESQTVHYELFIPEVSLLRFDKDGDKKISQTELEQQRDAIASYLERGIRLDQNQQPMRFSLKDMHSNEKDTIPGVSFNLDYTAQQPIESFTLHYDLLFDDSDPMHINFVLFMEGQDVDQTVLDTAHRSYHYVSLHPAGLWSTLGKYFLLGVEHILTGYDHLLFLVSLLLISTRVKDILRIVTAFTVAHSITLFLAATGVVHLPSVWIETGIALTIAYVAVENIVSGKNELRWLLTFAFGLIHGLGFAGALEEIGLPQSYFVSSLLTFNLGVETGQLFVVAVVMPLLLLLQKRPYYRKIMLAGSAVVLVFAVKWALERMGVWG